MRKDSLDPGALLAAVQALAQLLVALVRDAQLRAQLGQHQLLALHTGSGSCPLLCHVSARLFSPAESGAAPDDAHQRCREHL